MIRRVTPRKSYWKAQVPAIGEVAATGARLTPRVDDDPLVASIHRISLTERPIDYSLADLKSVLVAMEVVRRQTYSTKVTRRESVLQMNDSRVLPSVPTAGVS
jgi:hypothetical protein